MSALLVLAIIVTPQTRSSMPDSLDRAGLSGTLLIDSLAAPRYVRPDRWLAMDKFWHLSASFATVGAAYHLSANRLNMKEPAPTAVSLGGTLCLGLAKEFCDLAGPDRHFSWKDVVADLAGIGLGYFVFIHRY